MAIHRHHCIDKGSKVVIHDESSTIYLCGQVAQNCDCGMADQTRQVLLGIDALLEEFGSDKTKILNVQIFIRDVNQFDEMNNEWLKWVPEIGSGPARACVQSLLMRPDLLVEMSVVAAK